VIDVMRMSADSDPAAAAGAIARGLRESGGVDVLVIGPRAVNQTVKAIAVARGYVASNGVDAYFVPSFSTIRVAETSEERTAIRFSVRTRHGAFTGTVPGESGESA